MTAKKIQPLKWRRTREAQEYRRSLERIAKEAAKMPDWMKAWAGRPPESAPPPQETK